jgi:hypothetical protein
MPRWPNWRVRVDSARGDSSPVRAAFVIQPSLDDMVTDRLAWVLNRPRSHPSKENCSVADIQPRCLI